LIDLMERMMHVVWWDIVYLFSIIK
jgi:hypothetical protein